MSEHEHGFEELDEELSEEGNEVAVVGMSARFPGASNVDEYWRNLRQGKESITFFDREELLAEERFSAEELLDPNVVMAGGILDDIDLFDAPFFGLNRREAEITDPQLRLLLECCWEAMENAGHDADSSSDPVGVFVGASMGTYLFTNIYANREVFEAIGHSRIMMGNTANFLSTWISYKMNLRGPSVTVQTACSTSLVAAHLAWQSLLNGECDLALAGASSISVPQKTCHLYREGGIHSPDGHCRAFDAKAAGTVGGNGVGVVVLKRLADALADGNPVHALIKGSAVNNDGSLKIGYTAPSVEGQAAVVAEALAIAESDPETVSYIEAHGTGTPLGDPIEISALTQVFRPKTEKKGFCAIGSVKSNIGHLDTAAGVAGLIKATLALENQEIPPSLHFDEPNPECRFPESPFFVNTELRPWQKGATPRRAGVSSLGIGGTNAHLVLEEAPSVGSSDPADPWQLLVLSARTETALEQARERLAATLRDKAPNLADVAFTLQLGRKAFEHRASLVARDTLEAATALAESRGIRYRVGETRTRPVAFLFPGQGAQHVDMAADIYRRERVFREAVEACCKSLETHLGLDLRQVLYPQPDDVEDAAERLRETRLSQPALLTVEYALSRLWMSWGITPQAMIGHSIGEYVAACVAGVMEVDDALALVAARGRLMQELEGGAMLAVSLAEAEVAPLLGATLSLAAVNAPERVTVSGPFADIEAFVESLEARGVTYRRLHTSHAFHSAMMDGMLEPYRQILQGVELRQPKIPFISNVTGTWIQPEDAMDPDYWVRHLRRTVRFSDGVQELVKEPDRILLEVGPGRSLATLVRLHRQEAKGCEVVSSLPPPDSEGSVRASLLDACGQLWLAGLKVGWQALYSGQRRRRLELPTYPFQRQRYWVDPQRRDVEPALPARNESAADESPEPGVAATPEPGVGKTRKDRLLATLAGLVENLTGAESSQLDPHASFFELGVDSLLLIQASQAIQREFGVEVPFRALFEELSTLDVVAAHLDERLPPDAFPEPSEPAPSPSSVEAPSPPQEGSESAAGETPLERVLNEQLRTFRRLTEQQMAMLREAEEKAPATAEAEIDSRAGKMTYPDRSPLAPAANQEYGPYRPPRRETASSLSADQERHLGELVERYTAKTRGSKEITDNYRQHLADNRSSVGFRKLWKEMVYPIVAERSAGSKIWDADGNEYVDLTMGFGVNLLGHSPPLVREALSRQLEVGIQIGPQSNLAGKVAKLLCELTGMERAAFCNSGTEAVMTALRLARTVTGQSRVAMFSGSYHGFFDGTLGRSIGRGAEIRTLPVAPGIPKSAVGELLVLDYGTEESLDILRREMGNLAAVLVEPVQSRRPGFQPREFLHEVRRQTAAAGTALIFDEVLTGFRIHPGGCQAVFEVEADIATYGKIVAGGMPIGVVTGNSRFMDAIDGGFWRFGDESVPRAAQTLFAGTFCKHPLAMNAAWAVLNHLADRGPSLQEGLNRRTASLVSRLNRFLTDEGVPLRLEHFGSLFRVQAMESVPFADLLPFHLVLRGVYVWEGATRFLSTAHSDDDVEQVVRAFKDSVVELVAAGFLPAVRRTPPRVATSERREIPMTSTQEQVWYLARMGEDRSRAFNESLTLRLLGPLDERVLRGALQGLVDRHELLRACFGVEEPRQFVRARVELTIPWVDLSRLRSSTADRVAARWVRWEVQRAFDLVRGPMLRVLVIRCSRDEHRLTLLSHHMVIDGASFGVLMRDFSALYRRGVGEQVELPPPVRFSEIAEQERPRSAAEVEAGETFWLDHFSGELPVLELPLDRPRPPVQTHNVERCHLALDFALDEALRAMSARQGATLFMSLLAGFYLLLRQLSGQRDVVVGVNATEPLPEDDQRLVGFRINSLALRSRIDDEMRFSDYLKTVKRNVLESYQHQHYPFSRLLKRLDLRRDPSRFPLKSVAMNLDHEAESFKMAGLEIHVETNASGAKHEMFLSFTEGRQRFWIDCDFNSDLFQAATIERWMNHLRRLLETVSRDPDIRLADLPAPKPSVPESPAAESSIEREPTKATVPADPAPSGLTRYQYLLWAGQKLQPDSLIYSNLHGFLIRGALDPEIFRRAFEWLIEHSDALRTVIEEIDGVPSCRILEAIPQALELHDLSASADPNVSLRELIAARSKEPFDLTRRLISAFLARLDAERFYFFLRQHHIITDNASIVNLWGFLAEIYEVLASQGDPASVKIPAFREYVSYEEKQRDSSRARKAEAYWTKKLAEPPKALELYPRQAGKGRTKTERVVFEPPAELKERLFAAAERRGGKTRDLALLNLLGGLVAAFLSRIGSAGQIALGVPLRNRPRAAFRKTLGLFLQIVPVRISVCPQDCLENVIASFAEEIGTAMRHLAHPVGNPLSEPTYGVELNLVTPAFRDIVGHRVEGEYLHPGHANESLLIRVEAPPGSGELRFLFFFRRDQFERAQRRRWVELFANALDKLLEEPEVPLSRIDLLTAAERRVLLEEHNRTAFELPAEESFLTLFEAQVRSQPRRRAAASAGRNLTYDELNRRANQLGHALVEHRVSRGDLVALILPRGLDFLVAVLGVMKAGAAYLPLDPEAPVRRTAQILEASGVRLVLTCGGFSPPEGLSAAVGSFADLQDQGSSEQDLSLTLTGQDLAYVIYTSGSTGAPKGAMVEHGGMLNHLFAKVNELGLGSRDGVLQNASQTFDISVWQLLGPLLVGGWVEIVDDEVAQDPRRLIEIVEDTGLTVVETVPTLLRVLVEELRYRGQGRPAFAELRWMIATGEALPPELCKEWLEIYPRVPVVNAYGPTECSDDVTHFTVEHPPPANLTQVPIGKATLNTRIHVVDRGLALRPLGMIGELCVAGFGVGRGYLSEPAQTSDVFVPDPFNEEPGGRLYRTGDLARWTESGDLEFLGRIDHQTKIRGFRIEIGEIEAALAEHPSIQELVVVARRDDSAASYLAAYVVGERVSEALHELRGFLHERLPDYMVPAVFMELERLPLNRNGKVDRGALPVPDPSQLLGGRTIELPRGRVEEILAGIWRQVLGVPELGIHDDFFGLGGDSILSIQIVARANRQGLRLSPMQVFEHPTIAELAAVAVLDRSDVEQEGEVTGPVPLTPIQRWFFEQEIPQRHHWNHALLVEVDEELHPGHVARSVECLIEHHDALRLRFWREGSSWLQRNASIEEGRQALALTVDLASLAPTAWASAIEGSASRLQASLNLEDGPLLRVALFQTGPGKPDRLFVMAHHLVIDGVSWRILLEDLFAGYRQLAVGSVVELPPRTVSFKRWAERLETWARSPELMAESSYWLDILESADPLPVDIPEARERAGQSVGAVRIDLDTQETDGVLRDLPVRLGARINDLLLTAVVEGFRRWSGETSLLVDLESHGRDHGFEGLDLSRTLGWLTSVYPVLLSVATESSVEESLERVRACLEAVPHNGLGYGVLRHMSSDPHFTERRLTASEVSFNYLGQLDRVVDGDLPFRPAKEPVGRSQSGGGQRAHLLSLRGMVLGGQLRMEWIYAEEVYHRETIESWAEGFRDVLRELIAATSEGTDRVGSLLSAGAEDFGWGAGDMQKIEEALRSGEAAGS